MVGLVKKGLVGFAKQTRAKDTEITATTAAAMRAKNESKNQQERQGKKWHTIVEKKSKMWILCE